MEQISTYSKMNAHLLTHTHISRIILYAAFLFIGVLCSVGNAWAQVTLTYEWTVTAGKSSLPSGVTQDGLGSDYAAANAPYYLKYDGEGDYIQIYTDAAASEVKFTVKMLGGNATSKFKVQGCETDDGDYSDIEEFTCSGAQNDVKTFTTSNTISSSYRYFRIIKSAHASGGNVGLGYVKITKAPTPATITLNNYSGSASTSGYLEGEEFELPSTNSYTCGTKTFVGWSTVEVATTDTKPSSNFYEPGESVTLGATNTFYAVFANRSGGGSPAFSRYQLVTSAPSDWSGKYVLSTGTYTATGAYSSNSLTCNSWTPGTTEATSREFIINKIGSTSHYSIALPGGTTYIGKKTGNSPGTDLISSTTAPTTADDEDNNKYKWTLSTTVIANVALTGRKLAAESSTPSKIKGYSDPESGSTYPVIKLYKRIEESTYTYSNYATNCCEAPGTALSITSSSSVATGGTVTLTSTGGNGGTVTWSVVNGTGSATIEGTTLTAGSVGTVTVKAHQNATGGYCEQDAEQAFTIISATVNVTGVEVSPTSKAIVPGETFTITPTISPSNATDKSVSWTSSASDKASVSSGTVTGVAAGTATITCTTTDGSYTAETAVTVYAVTMQALDEDGNAIAVGGPGTPSRTGASISPAADAGNYVFKEWAISGASLGSSASTKANTITNPTGAVTVTAKYYKPRVVKWSVNGNDSYNTGGPTTTVAYNGTISTVPTDPSGLACASTFVAWTDATHNNGQTAKDDDSYYESKLFTDASDFPNITAETTTFYAVFAEEVTSGTYSDGTTHQWLGSSGYSDWGGSSTYSWLRNNGKVIPTHAYTPAYGVKKVVLNVQQSNTTGSNTVAVTIGGTTVGTTQGMGSGTSAFDMTFDHGTGTPLTGEVRIVATNTSANTTGQGTFYLNSITLYEGAPDVELTNYVTECDANIVRVTYNANGGTTSCANTTTDKTEDYTVCSTEPTRDYYTFAGWLCSADDEVYAASATIDDAAINGDFTLTAQWTPLPYSITYELHDGTTAGGNPTTYNIETATIDLADGTYGHYRFEGWYSTYSAGVYSDQVTSIPTGSHGDITLHAKWTARNEINFYKDAELLTTIYRATDENIEASIDGQGSKPSNPSAPSACSSKVFVGWTETWFNDETDTAPADLNNATGTRSGSKTYYAVWATDGVSPSAYSTTCCANEVTVDGGSPTNGIVAFDKSFVWTCKGDREIVMTITPATGYQLATFEVATGDGKVAPKSMSADVVLNNNSSEPQVITLTFAKDADGAYDVTATFTEMKITSWVWTYNSSEIPDPIDVYVGQKKQIDVVMSPSGVLNSHKNNNSYTHNVNATYIGSPNRAGTYFTFEGKAAVESTPITLTHKDDTSEPKAFALTFNVRVTALPRVHFVDNIHNETFDDVVATVSGDKTTVTMVQSTPTHADVAAGSGNACETTHLHLIGWIRSDYSKVADYMAGTGDAPTTDELRNAGAEYWFLPDADINTETYNGKTFYAVWAVEE